MAITRLTRWSLGTLLDGLLAKAGGTMTGALTLFGAPTADLHAATKKYVDDLAALADTKAFCLVAQNGTILNQKNVASVVKSSTGRWTVTFTDPVDSGNYVVVGSCIATNCSVFMVDAGSLAAGGFNCSVVNGSNAYVDPNYIMFEVKGDLAA